jgi:hypothetical protein
MTMGDSVVMISDGGGARGNAGLPLCLCPECGRDV